MQTVVFPFVPVTPMTFSPLEGKPYKKAPRKARTKWYQDTTKLGVIFLTNSLIIKIHSTTNKKSLAFLQRTYFTKSKGQSLKDPKDPSRGD